MRSQQLKGNMGLKGIYTFRVMRDGKEIQRVEVENMIVDVGITAVINRMFSATPTNVCLVSHIAVGTGTNAPAAGNTILQTETARKAVLSRTNSGVIGAASTTFAAGEVPASTLREAAVFLDATGTANSGTLLSRVAINLVITALDSLFIDWRVTGSNV